MRFGAEEGTRTPTPLRVHGPEPCASANSATSAFVDHLSGQNGQTGSESSVTKAAVAVKRQGRSLHLNHAFMYIGALERVPSL